MSEHRCVGCGRSWSTEDAIAALQAASTVQAWACRLPTGTCLVDTFGRWWRVERAQEAPLCSQMDPHDDLTHTGWGMLGTSVLRSIRLAILPDGTKLPMPPGHDPVQEAEVTNER